MQQLPTKQEYRKNMPNFNAGDTQRTKRTKNSTAQNVGEV